MVNSSITSPVLLIDKKKIKANIRRMAEKARYSHAILRPHFKTHQSAEVAKLYKQMGIDKITASSVEMATFFAETGFNDITIAFPVNLLEIDKINRLASGINLNLLVDSIYSLHYLSNNLKNSVGVFIKVDVGYHRAGLLPDDPAIDEMITLMDSADRLNFKGFLTHAGYTYHAKGKREIMAIMQSAEKQLSGLKNRYKKKYPGLIISYGDTPSCSLAPDCSGFDELRPGNFVYYDVMQYHLGSCRLNDIAVSVACPVVSVYPQRNELIVYGGAVHLSKEFIEADNNFKLFGYVVTFNDKGGWSNPIPGAYVSSLSQEHGIIKMLPGSINNFKPGDLLGILPIHSCLTANLLSRQIMING